MPSFPRRRNLFASAVVVVLLGVLLFFRLREPGRLKLPAGNRVPQISLGSSHGLVIAPDGTLWSWGAEDLGWPVLGYGQTNVAPAFSPLLRRIDSGTNWVKVSARQDHNLALKSDGTIWTWGADYQGQLGIGSIGIRLQSSLVPSAPGNDWADVVAANVCSFALKKDGSLWAWGVNNFCRLGIGTSINTAVPVRVGPSTNWSKIRAGGVSGAGIQNDGSLWIWGGSPEFGNHAKNFTNNLAIPTRMTSATNWVDVAVDYNLWLAVKTDGTLWAFGKDAHAYTGALPSAFATPTRIGTNSDWMSVSTGRFGHLLRKRDGTFWRLGQFLGPGASDQLGPLDLPKDALDGDTGGGAVAVITRDGEVRAWGSALGERTSKVRLLDWLSNHGFRSGQRQWEKNQRDNPWSIHNIDPD